jgi:single-strand DNA-binding protein
MAKLFGLARIGRDAEVRFVGNDAVVNLSLAFTYGKKGEDGKRPTQWVDGAFWGKRAEALAPYLLKGGLIAAALDEVHIETFQGKNGEGTKLAGKVIDVELAGGGTPAAQPAAKPAARPAQQGGNRNNDMDDDIPFAPYMTRKAWAV